MAEAYGVAWERRDDLWEGSPCPLRQTRSEKENAASQ